MRSPPTTFRSSRARRCPGVTLRTPLSHTLGASRPCSAPSALDLRAEWSAEWPARPCPLRGQHSHSLPLELVRWRQPCDSLWAMRGAVRPGPHSAPRVPQQVCPTIRPAGCGRAGRAPSPARVTLQAPEGVSVGSGAPQVVGPTPLTPTYGNKEGALLAHPRLRRSCPRPGWDVSGMLGTILESGQRAERRPEAGFRSPRGPDRSHRYQPQTGSDSQAELLTQGGRKAMSSRAPQDRTVMTCGLPGWEGQSHHPARPSGSGAGTT